jgi:hypothetical protein
MMCEPTRVTGGVGSDSAGDPAGVPLVGCCNYDDIRLTKRQRKCCKLFFKRNGAGEAAFSTDASNNHDDKYNAPSIVYNESFF